MARKKTDELEALVGQVEGADKDLLSKLQAALGVGSKEEAISLIRKDPEARRIATKLIGSGGPLAVSADLGAGPDADLAQRLFGGGSKRRSSQSAVTF